MAEHGGLTAGERLGPYEVGGLIGAGGMGEVYRAVDTRLGRAVAIKLLPAVFAEDPDRLRRFEQEARATASLNHPAVLAVFDVGMHAGAPYLVCELLEGQTLRDRLKDGPLPIATAIDFGRQLAEGLAAAHERGITHRDLKPENVFVLPGDRIKILDFGLARFTAGAVESGGGPSIDETRQHTLPHTIVGTLGYMAPEQARGETVDHRADIFAFGCVLFEMLEGGRAFTGTTPADTISAILKDPPPDLRSSPERPLPPAVRLVVQRCLQKAPDARFQSARDLAFVLNSLTGVDLTHSAARVAAPVKARSRTPPWLALGAAGLAAIALLAMLVPRWQASPEASPTTEFLLPPPAGDQAFATMALPGLVPVSPQVGLSPNGRSLAFVASSSDRRRTLWIRSLDIGTPRLVPNTEGVSSWPFWSPDNRFLVVAIDRALHRVDAVTGATERLCSLPDAAPPIPFVTGSWRAPNEILLSIGGTSGIYRVAASGGTPEAITTLDAKRGDEYHSWPQWLPDGRFLVFVRTADARTTGTYAGRPGEPGLSIVMPTASRALYAAGRLLWVNDGRLMAQTFDAANLRLEGQSATIAPSVFVGGGRTPAFWTSESGVLAYAIGGSPERQFRWLDRDGRPLGDVGPPGIYASFDLSPDGARVVTEVSHPGAPPHSTLTTLDTARGVITPLTTGDRSDADPRFGPGGDVLFTRNSGKEPGVFRADPDGGEPSLIFARGDRPAMSMQAWSRDGRTFVFRSGADRDAWRVSLPGASGGAPGPPPENITRTTDAVDQVQLSPDGHWIVYTSAESGRYETYISPSVWNGRRWRLSKDGGVQATWRADGREVYFLGLDAAMNLVEVTTAGDQVTLTAPRRLFRTLIPAISPEVEQYRPTADGQRFLFCLPLTSVRQEPLRVILNWPARVPTT